MDFVVWISRYQLKIFVLNLMKNLILISMKSKQLVFLIVFYKKSLQEHNSFFQPSHKNPFFHRVRRKLVTLYTLCYKSKKKKAWICFILNCLKLYCFGKTCAKNIFKHSYVFQTLKFKNPVLSMFSFFFVVSLTLVY